MDNKKVDNYSKSELTSEEEKKKRQNGHIQQQEQEKIKAKRYQVVNRRS